MIINHYDHQYLWMQVEKKDTKFVGKDIYYIKEKYFTKHRKYASEEKL